MVYFNGDTYDGQWQYDMKHGYGIYKYSQSGDLYDGNWVNDMRDGYGKFQWKSGDMYEGYFKNNQVNL